MFCDTRSFKKSMDVFRKRLPAVCAQRVKQLPVMLASLIKVTESWLLHFPSTDTQCSTMASW